MLVLTLPRRATLETDPVRVDATGAIDLLWIVDRERVLRRECSTLPVCRML